MWVHFLTDSQTESLDRVAPVATLVGTWIEQGLGYVNPNIATAWGHVAATLKQTLYIHRRNAYDQTNGCRPIRDQGGWLHDF